MMRLIFLCMMMLASSSCAHDTHSGIDSEAEVFGICATAWATLFGIFILWTISSCALGHHLSQTKAQKNKNDTNTQNKKNENNKNENEKEKEKEKEKDGSDSELHHRQATLHPGSAPPPSAPPPQPQSQVIVQQAAPPVIVIGAPTVSLATAAPAAPVASRTPLEMAILRKRDELDSLYKRDALRDMCRLKQLPVTGLKMDLADRIARQYYATAASL